jgi:dTDP-4-dehydrorhamnose reductase
MPTILITGGQGQLGLELAMLGWPEDTRLLTPMRAELDITDALGVERYFSNHVIDAVINAAAYTAVDKAEAEIAAAFAANAGGPALLAKATKEADIPLVHISTDYVFDGRKSGAYDETDPVSPLGVYGASKEAGEQAVSKGNRRAVILRTAWVVSPHRQNFVKTMLRLGVEQPAVRVVDDQRGCPTSAADLARVASSVALRMLSDESAPTGTFQFVNDGDATWCDLARHVFAVAATRGRRAPAVEAITTAQFPAPARRPANSRLSTAKLRRDYGIVPRPWQEAVTEIVTHLVARAETTTGAAP